MWVRSNAPSHPVKDHLVPVDGQYRHLPAQSLGRECGDSAVADRQVTPARNLLHRLMALLSFNIFNCGCDYVIDGKSDEWWLFSHLTRIDRKLGTILE